MIRAKIGVHNLNEIKALIKEAYVNANEYAYHEAVWISHRTGEQIARSFIRDTEFEIVVEDVDSLDGYRSVIVEVL